MQTPCCWERKQIPFLQACFLSLPPIRQDLTQIQWPKGQFIVRFKRGGGQACAETRTLLDYTGHWLTKCNVSLMTSAGHGLQTWVLVWMPDYSLNWTKRSSAIQCLSMTLSSTWRWPSQSQEPFSLESVLDLEITVEVLIPPSGSDELGCQPDFWYYQLCLYSVNCYYTGGPSEVFYRKFLY